MPRAKVRPEAALDLDPHGLPAQIRDFIEHQRSRNYSEATVRNRLACLRRFTLWCADRGLLQAREITKPILESYQRALFHYRRASGAPLSFRSQAVHMTSVRSFFRHLARSNQILYNPAADLELPKVEQRLPRAVLTAREADQVLNVPDVKDAFGLRDRAMLEVLYCCGLRRKELVGLRFYDLDAERQTLLVRQGKGKKDRMVPIGERALAWVHKYLADVRPQLVTPPDEGVLFLTMYGAPLSVAWLTDRVRGYVEASGVGKRGSCHLFRHTMATLMLEGGADIRFIQEMLGHADPKTTQIYTLVSIKKLQKVHAATHPAAHLQGAPAAPEPPGASSLAVGPRAELLAQLEAEEEEEAEGADG
jgi:integrase/recombinase XerD